jgi:phage/plasmid-like protein (TIGR03299 family)
MLEATQNVYMDRTATWSSIGKDVQECADMEQVLKASGLDYEVEKRPVFTYPDIEDDGTRMVIPNRFVTTRKLDGHIYDVVSDKFEVIQNRDAFDFVNYMGDEISFEKAGETANGMVYVIAKLPEVNILGDKFTPHILFRNGFSGKVKITAAICPLRIVCQNQFNFSFKNVQNTITIRHVQNAELKLEEARETLKMSTNYMTELNTMAEKYATIKLSKFQLVRFMKEAFPIDGIENMNPFKRKTLEEARERFVKAHEMEDNMNFKGTAWGLINAYTDYITHKVPQGNTDTKFEGKFIKVTFGQSMNRILALVDSIAA